MSGAEYEEAGAGARAAWAIVTVASIMPAASATREPPFKRNENMFSSFGLPSRGRGRTWSKRSRSKTTLRCSDTFTIRAARPRDGLGFYLLLPKERRSADFGAFAGGQAIGLVSEPPWPKLTLSIFTSSSFHPNAICTSFGDCFVSSRSKPRGWPDVITELLRSLAKTETAHALPPLFLTTMETAPTLSAPSAKSKALRSPRNSRRRSNRRRLNAQSPAGVSTAFCRSRALRRILRGSRSATLGISSNPRAVNERQARSAARTPEASLDPQAEPNCPRDPRSRSTPRPLPR